MLNKLLSTRALQVAGSLALCAFAIASQAAPSSLTGSCHLTSMIPGKAECYLTYILHDDFITPFTTRRSQVRINGVIAGDWINDDQNPVDTGFVGVSGTTIVACGTKHKVAAFVSPVGSTPFERVGSLPRVTCPAAP